MTVKEQAIKAIGALPEDADFEAVIREIEFVAGVQKGLDELDRGEGIPIEKMRNEKLVEMARFWHGARGYLHLDLES